MGNITTADQVNTIIAAGRADLCALARTHLVDPNFTLLASAQYGFDPQFWPSPFLAGKEMAFRTYSRQNAELEALRRAARPHSPDERREQGRRSE